MCVKFARVTNKYNVQLCSSVPFHQNALSIRGLQSDCLISPAFRHLQPPLFSLRMLYPKCTFSHSSINQSKIRMRRKTPRPAGHMAKFAHNEDDPPLSWPAGPVALRIRGSPPPPSSHLFSFLCSGPSPSFCPLTLRVHCPNRYR